MEMKYELAQVNIGRFLQPQEHSANADFVNNLDRINAIAESQPGFIWRFTGAGNNAMDVKAYDDPNMAINMSVWADVESLVKFVYRNEAHREIMRRRREWFEKIEFYMVLWWVEQGQRPTTDEAKRRLELLKRNGPSREAFTFKSPYPHPGGDDIDPFKDECA